MARWDVVATLLGMLGCTAETSSVEWQIQVADGVSPDLDRIEAALRIGGCWHGDLPSHDLPGRVDDGYAPAARAWPLRSHR